SAAGPHPTPPRACSIARRATTTTAPPFFFFQAEDGIRDYKVTGVQTCALPICALDLVREDGRRVTVQFRRGTPAHLDTDDPDLSLPAFLRSKKVLAAEQATAVQEATNAGSDPVSILLQRQIIAPADAHRLLGEHALFLLDRAVESARGRFAFRADAPAPDSAFPLGQKWTLLAETVRRLDAGPLRARLGSRLAHPVVRSGGLGIGKVEELALNAQETRLYAGIDGTRTGGELLKQGDPRAVRRLL